MRKAGNSWQLDQLDLASFVAPHAGAVSAIALSPRGKGYYLGLQSGGIVRVANDGSEERFDMRRADGIDGLERRTT